MIVYEKMKNNKEISGPYPGGHVQFSFNMYVDHKNCISCKLDHPYVKEIIFEKCNPDDEFDPKWFMNIALREVNSIEEVGKIGNTIKDNILDKLCLILSTSITGVRLTGHGLTPRDGEGAIAHVILPAMQGSATASCGGKKLDNRIISKIQNEISTISGTHHNPLNALFRYAICSIEPIVQFMMLYLILCEIFNNQVAIDEFIVKQSPETIQTSSPHNQKPETIYRRLRNEVTHRTANPPESMRNEIISNISEFKKIVKIAIEKHG